eukprot:765800-Hanusia_phi.AAC.6
MAGVERADCVMVANDHRSVLEFPVMSFRFVQEMRARAGEYAEERERTNRMQVLKSSQVMMDFTQATGRNRG